MLHTIRDALIGQQLDPRAFLQKQQAYPRRIYWPAWGLRAGVFVAAIGILIVSARPLNTDQAQMMIAMALLMWFFISILGAVSISTLGLAQFWFLWTYSPCSSALILLAGLSAHPGIWRAALLLELPFYLGKFSVIAGSLWAQQRCQKQADDAQRQRPGGVTAQLPALTFWRGARRLRWLGALLVSSMVIYFYPVIPAQALPGGELIGPFVHTLYLALSLSAGIAGALGLDATLLAALSNRPVARWDTQSQRWHVTYVGRNALLVPHKCWLTVLAAEEQRNGAILALLQQGDLGPALRRACKQLAPADLERLLFELSLQAGGGAVVEYLQKACPAELQPWAAFYAALAREAAKPGNLQGWVQVFAREYPEDAWHSAIITPEALARLRQVLLAPTPEARDIAAATQDLRRITSKPQPAAQAAWPQAMWQYLEQRQAQFKAAGGAA